MCKSRTTAAKSAASKPSAINVAAIDPADVPTRKPGTADTNSMVDRKGEQTSGLERQSGCSAGAQHEGKVRPVAVRRRRPT